MDKYSVAVVDSTHEWEITREQWNNLLAKSKSNNIFLTFEWLYSWWNIYFNERKKLFILYIYNEDILIGIAPWYINSFKHGPLNHRQLEFIGSKEAGSDYLDVICMEGEEINISSALYKYIHNEFKEWNSLFLYDFPANSMFFMNFIGELKNDGKYYVLNTASFCPVVNLPNNIEVYESGMTSKRRKKLKYIKNRVSKKGQSEIDTVVYNGNERYIDDFFDFYERVRNIKNDKLRMLLKYYSKYEGNTSNIKIITVKQEDSIMASILHLIFGNKIYNYLVATDKNYVKNASVGEILVYECIIHSINDKYGIYDFGKGEEPYKFKWSNNGERSLEITYHKFGLVTFYLFLVDTIKNIAKYILR